MRFLRGGRCQAHLYGLGITMTLLALKCIAVSAKTNRDPKGPTCGLSLKWKIFFSACFIRLGPKGYLSICFMTNPEHNLHPRTDSKVQKSPVVKYEMGQKNSLLHKHPLPRYLYPQKQHSVRIAVEAVSGDAQLMCVITTVVVWLFLITT